MRAKRNRTKWNSTKKEIKNRRNIMKQRKDRTPFLSLSIHKLFTRFHALLSLIRTISVSLFTTFLCVSRLSQIPILFPVYLSKEQCAMYWWGQIDRFFSSLTYKRYFFISIVSSLYSTLFPNFSIFSLLNFQTISFGLQRWLSDTHLDMREKYPRSPAPYNNIK